MSGFFSARNLKDKNIKISEYYKKRLIKIVPAYYVTIVALIIYHISNSIYIIKDIWRLGWLRYFLFLNTVLPSNDFETWNNLFGLWTISNFVFFYLIAPFILKKTNIRRLVLFFGGTIAIKIIYSYVFIAIFSRIEELEKIDVLAGTSPIGTLWQFVLGALIYYAVSEKKQKETILIGIICFTFAAIVKINIIIYCSLSTILICLFEIFPNCKKKTIGVISNYTYYIYLLHELTYEIAWKLANRYVMRKIYIYLILVIIILFFSCIIMGRIDKKIAFVYKKWMVRKSE